MNRRTILKWLHWMSFGLILWFWLVEPQDVERLGGAALATHAGMGMVLAVLTTVWFTLYWRKGLTGRAGPKLPGWAKWAHPFIHKLMMWGMPGVVLSGALAGFAAPYAIKAFGILPLFPGVGSKSIHGFFEEIHEMTFDILLIVLAVHVGFHVWRHYMVRDNALRIMVPKALHRYL